MKSCIFCKIIEKEIPANIVMESENIIAFYDINPSAPIHILIVPKKHIGSVNDLEYEDKEILGEMFIFAKELAKKEGVSEKGYRIIVNTGNDGGQLVEHLHMHLLGGKRLGPKIVH